MHTRALFIPLVVAAQVGNASGGEPIASAGDFDELPVVLSASRLSQPLIEAPSAVTVIDRRMIEASGARHIADLMRYVPGAIVGYNDGNHPVVSMHGMSGTYAPGVQVLIDGVSVYSPFWGGMQWEELPLAMNDIERIEVIRGPNAAVFGPNSFNGVINIITRDPGTNTGWEVSGNVGETAVSDFSISRSGSAENGLKYRATFGQRASDGFDSRPDTQVQRYGNLRTEYQMDVANSLQVSARIADNKKDVGDYTATGSNRVPHPDDSGLFHFQARWTNASSADSEWWVQYYHQQSKTSDRVLTDFRQSALWDRLDRLYNISTGGHLVSGAIPYVADSSYETARDGVEFQTTTRWSPSMRSVAGFEARRDAAQSSTYLGPSSQSAFLTRLYGNVEWRFATDWTLNTAAMVERNSLSSIEWSPKLAVTWQAMPGHVFRAGVSAAQRTPALYESKAMVRFDIPPQLLAQLAPVMPYWATLGWPDAQRITLYQSSGTVRSETMQEEELGYSFSLPDSKVGAEMRLAKEHYHGLITIVTGSQLLAPADAANYDRVEVTGADATIRWTPFDGTLLRLALGRTTITSPTSPRIFNHSAPRNTVSFLWDQEVGQGWRWSTNYQRVGAMYWTDAGSNTNNPQLPAIEYLTLRLAKRLSLPSLSKAEVAVVLQNAFGNHREYFAGVATNGTAETVASHVTFLQLSAQF